MSWQMMRFLVEVGFGLHLFVRLRVAFGGGWWQAPVLGWMGLMLLPLLFMRRGLIPAPLLELLLWLWPVWMGFLLLFTFSILSLDFIRLAGGLAGSLAGKSWWGALAARRAVPAALVLAALLCAHSAYMAYHPRLVKVEFSTGRLPDGVKSLRLVQISDVHLSRFIGHGQLKRITDLVASAGPDILLVTGDLVDTDMSRRADDAALLAGIKTSYGAFAVLGNHEWYAGQSNSVKFHQLAGLRLLRGEAVEAGGIVVAGMDDEVFGHRWHREPPEKLLGRYKDDPRFMLFLKHRPQPAPGTDGLFDLQLSGHTHGGQIFPGHVLIKMVNYYLRGSYALSSRSSLYVNSGAGFWGLPYRFLAPPEVTVIDLKAPAAGAELRRHDES